MEEGQNIYSGQSLAPGGIQSPNVNQQSNTPGTVAGSIPEAPVSSYQPTVNASWPVNSTSNQNAGQTPPTENMEHPMPLEGGFASFQQPNNHVAPQQEIVSAAQPVISSEAGYISHVPAKRTIRAPIIILCVFLALVITGGGLYFIYKQQFANDDTMTTIQSTNELEIAFNKFANYVTKGEDVPDSFDGNYNPSNIYYLERYYDGGQEIYTKTNDLLNDFVAAYEGNKNSNSQSVLLTSILDEEIELVNNMKDSIDREVLVKITYNIFVISALINDEGVESFVASGSTHE